MKLAFLVIALIVSTLLHYYITVYIDTSFSGGGEIVVVLRFVIILPVGNQFSTRRDPLQRVWKRHGPPEGSSKCLTVWVVLEWRHYYCELQ
jgi:uncharacterized membrane protein YraQ (UPF0718 family)